MKNRFRTALFRTLAIACTAVLAACAQTAPPAAVPHPDAHADLRRYDDAWFAAARLGRIDILQALVDAHYPIDAATRRRAKATPRSFSRPTATSRRRSTTCCGPVRTRASATATATPR